MAQIEDLIREITDIRLRTRIAAEVGKLKTRKKFGLVFEQHLPETVQLPSLPVKPGARVAYRDGRAGIFVVSAIKGKSVSLIPEGDGGEQTASTEEVTVVKRFGEPIFPSLIPVDRVMRAPGKPFHTLINAENFHALQLLLYCYEGQVDVIYIDPPYNSGARDWKYNNDYVDRADQYRHSKWLSMMKRRLELAKRLLKPDGVLIVTIDENEVGHLLVLLEDLFPQYLRHMVTAVINPKGTGKHNFARVDEYVLFCVPNSGTSVIKGIPSVGGGDGKPGGGSLFYPSGASLPLEEDDPDDGDEEDADDQEESGDESESETDIDADDLPFPVEELAEWEPRHARRRGSESSYRHQRPNQFYPIYVDAEAKRVVRAGPSLPDGKAPSFAKVDGLVPVWPIDKDKNERCWRLISRRMQSMIDANRVKLGQYNATQKSWTLNIWYRRAESKKLKTVWWKTSHDAGTHGSTLLSTILGRRAAFQFPKSIYAVADALAAVVRTRPNALIVDFFAGSGTTLQATCMLNALHGGNRRCVLVTNNEVDAKLAARLLKNGTRPGDEKYEREGICQSVTWPRTQAVLLGKRGNGKRLPGNYLDGRAMGDGFAENAEYFKLDFLDPSAVRRGESYEAILPILWLLAGASGELELSKGSGKYHFPKRSPFCVLLKEDSFREFAEKLATRTDITHVFLVTDSVEAFHEMSAGLDRKVRVIQLYKSYLDNFRINLEHRNAD